MRIPPEKLEEISSANDIVDVISQYIQVKKRGKSFLAVCPFHPDKNPSLHISQEKQVYHCFSCKAGGNVFSFVQEFEKIGFIDAATKLAERVGISISLQGKGYDTSNEVSLLYEINKSAAAFFYKTLAKVKSNEGEFVRTYLKKRGIGKEAIEEFGIGYSLNKWDALLHHFTESGNFSEEDIEKAGLIIKRDDEKEGYYDRFRGRLMFPIFNESGKVVGFGGRKLLEDDPGGKYINSPETRIYNKSKILYGLNFAKDHIRYAECAVLVEGYMDLISMHRHGVKNVVASSGTALTEDQVKLLSRYTKKVIVLYDSDAAGISAARRGAEIILAGGLDLDVVTLPDGEDPDSFLGKRGKQEFEAKLKSGRSWISFISELYASEGKLSTVEGKADFIREIIALVSRIPDAIKRGLYVKELSSKYGLYETDIKEELDRTLKRNKAASFPPTSLVIPEINQTDRKDRTSKSITVSEKELIKIFTKGDDEALSYVENNLEICFFEDGIITKIVEHFLDECVNHERPDVNRVIMNIDDEECTGLIMEAIADKHESSFFHDSTFDSLLEKNVYPVYDIEHAKGVINSLRMEFYNRQIESLRKDPEKLTEVFELKKKIAQLKKESKWVERL